MRQKPVYIFWLVLIFVTVNLAACKAYKERRVIRKSEKAQAEQAKESDKAYKTLLKRHRDLQSESTRKRMKENRKKVRQKQMIPQFLLLA